MASWCIFKKGDMMIIHASKLATCAGLNPYESRDAYIAELRDKSFVSQDDLAEIEISKLDKDVRDEIRGLRDTKFESAKEVASALSSLSLEPIVQAKIKKDLFTKHGTEQEGAVRNTLGPGVEQCKRYKVGKLPFCTVDNFEVYLGGKHDGKIGDKIVEIKTRSYKFLGVREYERVQVHAYMHIFETRQAELVESYNGETRTHAVPFDDAFWTGVKESVYTLVREIVC